MYTDCFPTRDLLCRRRIECDDLCPLCSSEKESIWHLFVDCRLANAIWTLANFYFQNAPVCSFNYWFKINMQILNTMQLSSFIISCWDLWKQRNDKVWNNKNTIPANATLNRATTFLMEWKEAAVNSMKNNIELG